MARMAAARVSAVVIRTSTPSKLITRLTIRDDYEFHRASPEILNGLFEDTQAGGIKVHPPCAR